MAIAPSRTFSPAFARSRVLCHPDVTVRTLLTSLPRSCSPRLRRQPPEGACVIGARASRLGEEAKPGEVNRCQATRDVLCVMQDSLGPAAALTQTPPRKQNARQGGDVPAKSNKVSSFLPKADPPHERAACLPLLWKLGKGSECVLRALG